jgi:uncharacterized repeat protein (TIGR03803 family)
VKLKMNRRHLFLLVLAISLTLVSSFLSAQTEQTLYSFSGYSDGGNPLSSLIMDGVGNLYGTTFVGGAYRAGEVFELSPGSGGGWIESVLYSFTGGVDGANPYFADVIFDAAGNLYGTTVGGGSHNLGTVFELSPSGSGWSESVLYSFGGGSDGANPYSGLLFDARGNLYGTTYGGGAYSVGTVFELSHVNGQWAESVIHTFNVQNGNSPAGGLVFDRKGNLFGVTQGGGAQGYGVVYELTPSAAQTWAEKVVYSFTGGADGGSPYAERLIVDHAERLYGTTNGGGVNQGGTVFRLAPRGQGSWKAQVLYSFDTRVAGNPFSGLVFDEEGNLYGTCANGNGVTTVGAVFELIREPDDNWTPRKLHMFSRTDGEFPEAALLRDAAGNLYGTTLLGGASNMGVVFEVSR